MLGLTDAYSPGLPLYFFSISLFEADCVRLQQQQQKVRLKFTNLMNPTQRKASTSIGAASTKRSVFRLQLLVPLALGLSMQQQQQS
mmetsp:Transcript_21336/g.52235  ORF Transcript_21336/g.52235 Transcript_21336/m.52235 type:complete len:86 (-) Transcript_21336:159-416(-)